MKEDAAKALRACQNCMLYAVEAECSVMEEQYWRQEYIDNLAKGHYHWIQKRLEGSSDALSASF